MKRLLISVAALVFAGSAQANPNLIVNGSFEQGLAGLGSFAGWTTSLGDDGTFVDSSGRNGTHFNEAPDGLWSAFFGSTMADGGATIAQLIPTVAGQTFTFSFDLANDNGGGAALDAFAATVNGVALFSATALAPQDYTHRSFTFVGSGATTRIAFQGYNDNGYVELDNVAVSAVPEPATWALVGGVLVFAAPRLRSRRRG